MPVSSLIALALGILVVAFLFLWVCPRLVRKFQRAMIGPIPRFHQSTFVRRLRELSFENPTNVMTRLWADDRQAYIQELWRETGRNAAILSHQFATRPDTGSGSKEILQEAAEPEDASQHPVVINCQSTRAHLMAVIQMPPTTVRGEACFIALVLPPDPTLHNNLAASRRALQFFLLSLYGGPGRETDLTGWTSTGEQLYYNCGAPLDPKSFATVVQSKLT